MESNKDSSEFTDGERAILKLLGRRPIELYWGRNGWVPQGLPKAAKRKDFDALLGRQQEVVRIEAARMILVCNT